METVSVVLSVRNEEAKIEQTLASVAWADEIILIDNGSTDKTAMLAKKHGAKVYHGQNNPMLNVNKNIGFTKATSDWILSLDGDEMVPPELANEIQQVIHHTSLISHNPDAVGYWIPRKNILFGKWIRHGIWWPDKQLRLFRRGKGAFPCHHVHEYLSVDGPTDECTQFMLHQNYETVSQFIRKMDELYTVSEVERHSASGYTVAWYDAVRFPLSDFVKTYFAQKGYKDGLHGLVLSILQAFYSFIVFAKLWEKEKFKDQELPLSDVEKEFRHAWADVRYWILSAKIFLTGKGIKQLWYRMLRKYATHH